MKIASYEYNIRDRSLEIYVSGCKSPHCEGCHNPELWDFNVGKDFNMFYEEFYTLLDTFDGYIDRVVIMGGEPLDQSLFELNQLIAFWSSMIEPYRKEIWVYTKYSLEEVPNTLKETVDYIKCGRFDINNLSEGNIQYGLKLASSNQNIYKKGEDY